jgi:hypothetical protein
MVMTGLIRILPATRRDLIRGSVARLPGVTVARPGQKKEQRGRPHYPR